MQFIDKTINQANAHNLLTQFLSSRWSAVNNHYSNIGYNDSEFQPTKQNLKSILINEQNQLCCYCMRKLAKDSTTTLEHIIPRATTTLVDFNNYTHISILHQNVVLQSVFETATMPQPHHLSRIKLLTKT